LEDVLASDRIPGLDPGIHASPDVIRVGIAKVRQRLCRDVAPVTGLTVDDDVFIQSHADFAMARLDLAKVNVEISAGNKSRGMLLW
jgi:hypothetical protein